MGWFGKWRQQQSIVTGVNYTGLGYCGLALLWLGISAGLKAMEYVGCVFELTAVIEIKAMVIVVVWIGRFYCFPQARLEFREKIWCAFLGLLLASLGLNRIVQQFDWAYLLLVGADTLLWTVILAVLLETLGAVYYLRMKMTAPRPSQLEKQWRAYWAESLKLGVWLALMCGLSFFYLVSFYRCDVYFYSRVLAVSWLGAELVFYGLAYWRLTSGLRAKLILLEREIADYLGWPTSEPMQISNHGLPVLQYLLLSRSYLQSRQRPVISGWALGGLAIVAGFLFELPQLIGSVIKV